MAIEYDPIARYGQEQYILAGLWAMRYDAQNSVYVGSPYAVSQPSKFMIDPQFASADGKVLGATTGKATMLQHANVSIATRGADDNLDALITGTDLIRNSADDEREWSMNAGELLFPIGLVGIGRTIDGGYCRMVVPQFVADNLGSTPGSGTDPELPEREISGMGLAWVNPLDTTERRPCRRRGFADDVGNYAAPSDPANVHGGDASTVHLGGAPDCGSWTDGNCRHRSIIGSLDGQCQLASGHLLHSGIQGVYCDSLDAVSGGG